MNRCLPRVCHFGYELRMAPMQIIATTRFWYRWYIPAA
jgi:hypothetical protein